MAVFRVEIGLFGSEMDLLRSFDAIFVTKTRIFVKAILKTNLKTRHQNIFTGFSN